MDKIFKSIGFAKLFSDQYIRTFNSIIDAVIKILSKKLIENNSDYTNLYAKLSSSFNLTEFMFCINTARIDRYIMQSYKCFMP